MLWFRRDGELDLPKPTKLLLPVRPSLDPYAPPQMRPMIVPLDEVAYKIRTLTYGDMMEMCEGTQANPKLVWLWARSRL